MKENNNLKIKRRKRERLEIIKDILYTIKSEEGLRPWKLIYSCNLSPQLFKECTNELISKGFIKSEIDGRKSKIFSITDKGNKFLAAYKVIQEFGLGKK